jgi:hypothetical protein
MTDEGEHVPTFRRVVTIINNLAEDRQIARLDGPLLLPEGIVIELGNPNRDAVVLGSRRATPGGDTIDLIYDVSDGEPGDFIPRHPADRLIP